MRGAPTLDWHLVLTKKANHWEATQWCTEQLGPRWDAINNRSGIWCTFWAGPAQFDSYAWHFKNESDVAWFMLRWS